MSLSSNDITQDAIAAIMPSCHLSPGLLAPNATHSFPPPFRGLLRNGNPSGNPNAAPRCGAKNRAGVPCRAPAMPNGRCRCHGGKSTGPRTPEGQARSATANIKHGNTTAPCRIRQRYIRTLITRSRLKCQARLLWPYLPREMFNRLAEGPEELWTPIHPSNVPFVQPPDAPTTPDRHHPTQPGAPTRPLPRALAAERAAARTEAASQAPWREAIAYARANKRDWLAFRRTDRTEKRAARAAKRAARGHATSLAANPQPLLPPPETPWADYTPLERELAARLAGLRAHTSELPTQPPSLAPTPDSTLPRIDLVNPEPAPKPTQNSESTHPRINPVNPEPAATQGTPATPRQHPQPPALSQPHQGPIAGDRPEAARAPNGQNAPTRTSPAAAPTPDSTLPRIDPMNPEPAAAPAPNPDSTPPRIYPVNPEPRLASHPTRLTPIKAQALRTTTLSNTWDPTLHATLAQRFGHRTPQ